MLIFASYAYVFITALATTWVANASSDFFDKELRAIVNKDLPAYARLHGMNLNIFSVVTSDGWSLEVHRVRNMDIFNERHSSPVLLSHGFGCTSFDYMANGRNVSLAFLLADSGYDVWAINYRATKFSNRVLRNGKLVDPTANDYYRATWQYMAERDVPAVLDKILEETNDKKIYLIGHSMGTTTLFSLLSQNYQYNDKIALFTALTPVIGYGDDTSEKLQTTFKFVRHLNTFLILDLFKLVYGRQVRSWESHFEKKSFTKLLLKCPLCKIDPNFCRPPASILQEMLADESMSDDPHIQKERLPLYYSVYPGGTTMMNVYMFARQLGRNPWTKMDYNEVSQTGITNMEEYHQESPPEYHFPDIKVNLAIHYVQNDKYTGLKTARRIINSLGLKRDNYRMHTCNNISHHDVIWAVDARCCVYNPVIERINSMERARGGSVAAYRREADNYARNVLGDDNAFCKKLQSDPSYDTSPKF